MDYTKILNNRFVFGGLPLPKQRLRSASQVALLIHKSVSIGESGSGKEVFLISSHHQFAGAFIAVNCGRANTGEGNH
jgi:transcriptional regulator with PAS, ATPase and Fis domain